MEKKELPISTILSSHRQYAYTNGPKLEHKMWHLVFDLQVHVCGELHLCCQKTKSVSSLPLILESKFFGGRRVQTTPFGTLALCFQIICETLALVTSNYSVQKVCVTFDRFNKVISVIKALFFLFGCQCMWHKPHAEFPFL